MKILLLPLLILSMNVLADEITINVPNENNIITYKEICLGGRLFATAISSTGYKSIRNVALVQVRDGTRGGHEVQCFNKAKKQSSQ